MDHYQVEVPVCWLLLARPRDLETICIKCLEKSPSARYQSAAALGEDLRRFVRDESILARRPRLIERCARFIKKRKPIVIAVLVSSVGGVLTTTAIWHSWRGDNQPDKFGNRFSVVEEVPLKIDFFEIRQLVRIDGGEYQSQNPWMFDRQSGVPLTNRFLLRYGDGLQFRVKLSAPAYCYWVAFRPDQIEELCFPVNPNQSPPLTDQPQYPETADAGNLTYGLTDGIGLQAFALVATERPLPPYEEWLKNRDISPWQDISRVPVKPAVRHHNGEWERVYRIDNERQIDAVAERPEAEEGELQELVTWLRQDSTLISCGLKVLDVWAVPVLPRN